MQRVFLNVLLFITAVVLCALPFFVLPQNKVYVYTKNIYPDSREDGFVGQLQKKGYRVYINKEPTSQEEVAIWFKSFASIPFKEAKAKFTYNFIYSEDYSVVGFSKFDDNFIVLTPYVEIYEHYMRSNIKSAMFYLGVNTKDFTYLAKNKKYMLTYYELRNKNTLLIDYLKKDKNVQFVGKFWNNNHKEKASYRDIAKKENKILNDSFAVIVDNSKNPKLIPEELIRATMSRALVLTNKTPSVYDIYKENLVYYENKEDIKHILSYYKKHKGLVEDKTKEALNVTINKMSSSSSAKRFDELLNWLKITNNKQ